MQPSDLKIGALYVVNALPDCTYRRYGPLIHGGPALHNFTLDDGKTALGLSDWQLAGNVKPAPVTDLHALATRAAASNHARRLERLRDWYARLTEERRAGHRGAVPPFDEWLPAKLREQAERDFLHDNYPAGATFDLVGVLCMSAGVKHAHAVEGGPYVAYLAASPDGLQERRLPFAMAAAAVLGAPV